MKQPAWYNKDTQRFMRRKYLRENETIVSRIQEIAKEAGEYLETAAGKTAFDKHEWVQKFADYVAKGYFSLSTPVWANFGLSRNALPISCNGTYVPDDMAGIMDAVKEVAIQSKYGAGTSIYLGKLRAKTDPLSGGGYASGPAHLSQLFDTVVSVVNQGNTRRGNLAAYVDITHPDIDDFFRWRQEGSEIKSLSWGVCIPNSFMEELESKPSERTVRVWKEVLRTRIATGYPYLYFSDTAADKAHPSIRDMYRASNLCTEIILPTDESNSFVCCLASMNAAMYDAWRHTDAVEILVDFLNAVLDEYVIKAKRKSGLEKCVTFVDNYRAIGIGLLGYQDYLQSHLLPFSGSHDMSVSISRHIESKAYSRSRHLLKFEYYDEVLDSGRANLTLTAIAPTTSSSFILGQTSPSIEPLLANYFVKDLAAGKYTFFNKHLLKLANDRLDEQGVEAFIVRLKENQGSVQNEQWMEEELRDVFKCFFELNQRDVITVAASRQPWVDQAQSINLMYNHTNAKVIHEDIMVAWRMSLPTLYYHRGLNPSQTLVSSLKTTGKSTESMIRVAPQVASQYIYNKQPTETPNITCTDDACVVCEG